MQRLATAGGLLRVWGEPPPSLSPQTDRPLDAAQQSPPLTGAETATMAETAIGAAANKAEPAPAAAAMLQRKGKRQGSSPGCPVCWGWRT